ncbi:acetyltransferase, GNAT family [Bacillus sp. JCM 19046]|nr:acetyltransferase, GNAT family [Bacillus sp. JCM 19045]GAF18317.1 acetyltransferase, GNAT family [Bacillus sp. JCM 19046]
MNDYQLVSNYRKNEKLRESFNELAIATFGMNFKAWYERGFWDERYIPYSFLYDGEVVANASVFKMTLVLNGKTYNAIQVGTVMTAPAHQKQRLAGRLMEHLLRVYAGELIYLYANKSVLDFYPRYGFKRVHESLYTIDVKEADLSVERGHAVQQVSLDHDRELLEFYAKHRVRQSNQVDVANNDALLLFYFAIPFAEMIYYIAELDTIVLMEHEGSTLQLYDVISLREPNIEQMVATCMNRTTKAIVCHFTPGFELKGMHVETMPDDDDALFVLGELGSPIKFPITSHC